MSFRWVTEKGLNSGRAPTVSVALSQGFFPPSFRFLAGLPSTPWAGHGSRDRPRPVLAQAPRWALWVTTSREGVRAGRPAGVWGRFLRTRAEIMCPPSPSSSRCHETSIQTLSFIPGTKNLSLFGMTGSLGTSYKWQQEGPVTPPGAVGVTGDIWAWLTQVWSQRPDVRMSSSDEMRLFNKQLPDLPRDTPRRT